MAEDIQRELVNIAGIIRNRIELEAVTGLESIPFSDMELPPLEIKQTREHETGTGGPLDDLKAEVEKCTACGLARTRNHVVFGEGDPNARLMFVGEAPGYHEDMKGKPFIGPAGKLLTKIVAAIEMTRREVYIGNILKCRPPKNRDPKPEEILACRGFLDEQIRLIRPEVIVALGAPAARTLLDRPGEAIGKLRGRFHSYNGIPVMPTYHPAYVLRNYTKDTRGKVWQDMQMVRDYLSGKIDA